VGLKSHPAVIRAFGDAGIRLAAVDSDARPHFFQGSPKETATLLKGTRGGNQEASACRSPQRTTGLPKMQESPRLSGVPELEVRQFELVSY
jgi:hypothetical protein